MAMPEGLANIIADDPRMQMESKIQKCTEWLQPKMAICTRLDFCSDIHIYNPHSAYALIALQHLMAIKPTPDMKPNEGQPTGLAPGYVLGGWQTWPLLQSRPSTFTRALLVYGDP